MNINSSNTNSEAVEHVVREDHGLQLPFARVAVVARQHVDLE